MTIDAEGALESISPIAIDYNSGLASHSSVRSGNGTSGNPYLISDYHIDCTSSGSTAISIRYTTDFLRIRNITIDAHSSNPAIYLRSSGWNAQNMILDNITINGGAKHLHMYVPVSITITRCTFNNPSGTGDIIYAYYGTEIYLTNNTFNCPDMDIDVDYSSSFDVLRNKGIVQNLDHLRWRYCNFANNSLQTDSIILYSGYFSDLQGNDITGTDPDEDLVRIVDTTPPEVDFVDGPDGHIDGWRGVIQWEIQEDVGIAYVNLTIDGDLYEISTGTTIFNVDLEEGYHEILLEVEDIAGYLSTAEMSFVLDMTSPQLEKSTRDHEVDGTKATIFWDLEEQADDLTWNMFMDGKEIKVDVDLSSGEFSITELLPGNHTIQLMVRDRAGNERTLSWDVRVEIEDRTESDIESGNSLIWIIILVLLLLAAIAVVLFIFRRPKEEDKKDIPSPHSKPDRIELGNVPAPSMIKENKIAGSPPPVRPGPAVEKKVSHEKKDGSYIRPAPKKIPQKKKQVIEAPASVKDPPSGATGTSGKGRPGIVPDFQPPQPEFQAPEVHEKEKGLEEWGEVEEWDGEEVEEWSQMEEI